MSGLAQTLSPGRRRDVALVAGWVLGVFALTAVCRARLVPLAELAASPEKVASGDLWPLVSSAFVMQRPLVASAAALAALAYLTLVVCGPRLLWLAAVAGHVGCTLLAYSLLAAIRLVEPVGGDRLLDAPDYGVSAIQAAWLGAVAATCWRRRDGTSRGRAFIVGACLAAGLFAWMLRGGLNVLDSEHVFAFGIGCVLAVGVRRSRTAARLGHAPAYRAR